jgi:hypothetical protein
MDAHAWLAEEEGRRVRRRPDSFSWPHRLIISITDSTGERNTSSPGHEEKSTGHDSVPAAEALNSKLPGWDDVSSSPVPSPIGDSDEGAHSSESGDQTINAVTETPEASTFPCEAAAPAGPSTCTATALGWTAARPSRVSHCPATATCRSWPSPWRSDLRKCFGYSLTFQKGRKRPLRRLLASLLRSNRPAAWSGRIISSRRRRVLALCLRRCDLLAA